MLPPVSGSSPAMQLSAVDLPQPDGPSSAMNSPRLTVERHAVERVDARRSCGSCRRAAAREIACIDAMSTASRNRHARAGDASPASRVPTLLRLLRADLLVPALERVDQLVRQQRQLLRDCRRSASSYSGRPNSLIASWLSFGAIDSGTSFTAGPG